VFGGAALRQPADRQPPSRFSALPGGKIPRFEADEFDRIVALILKWLPAVTVSKTPETIETINVSATVEGEAGKGLET
jgi:hypothetical protein